MSAATVSIGPPSVIIIIIIIIIVYYAEAAQYTAVIKQTKKHNIQTRFTEHIFFRYHMQHQQNVPTCET